MKKILKYIGYVVTFAIVIVAALLTYVKVALPNVGVALSKNKKMSSLSAPWIIHFVMPGVAYTNLF
jgi:hypothetical protein